MIFFEDSDRIFENENTLLKKGDTGSPSPPPAPRTRGAGGEDDLGESNLGCNHKFSD